MGMRVEGAKSGAAAAAWQAKSASSPPAASGSTPAAAPNAGSGQIKADMQSKAVGSSFSIHA